MELLHRLLVAYSVVLNRAVARVRDELGLRPTSRVKSMGTVMEKPDRYGGFWLKSIQDLAGMRIVGDFDRRGQDELVAQLVELFGSARRKPKVVDRRVKPMHGYRAVHVVVFPEGFPLEIQVRTRWQHEWGEFFEKLADAVGRGIRYGEPPDQPAALPAASRERAAVEVELREQLVAWALSVSQFIDSVERGEVVAADDPTLTGFDETSKRHSQRCDERSVRTSA